MTGIDIKPVLTAFVNETGKVDTACRPASQKESPQCIRGDRRSNEALITKHFLLTHFDFFALKTYVDNGIPI
jgi:hypothetical protein